MSVAKVLIVAGGALDWDGPIKDFGAYIGVDRGSLWLLRHSLPVTAAIGDFDSVTDDEFKQVSASAQETVTLPPAKDFTDFEVALDYAVSHFPDAQFTVLGALGGRIDHAITNYRLPLTQRFARYSNQITLVDEQNLIRYYAPGTHVIPRIPEYRDGGFDPLGTDSTLAIDHAKYPLKAGNTSHQTWASNEFVGATMTISFSKGFVVGIYSRDSHHVINEK
jgi:thiamine pyrophosphokinase